MGKFFRNIPLVVCTTFTISLVEALYILPAHLAHQKDIANPGPLHRLQQRFSLAFKRFVRERYGPFLDRALSLRYVTLSVACLLFIGILWLVDVVRSRDQIMGKSSGG